MTTSHLLPVMLAGQGNRRADDFYPTPRTATVALLWRFGHLLHPGPVWESACGDGAVSRVLVEHGHSVLSTDLVWRGYGVPGVDYLKARSAGGGPIVTNPPFNLAEPFIRKAVAEASIVAMLLKANFWNAKTRIPLFEETRPRWIAQMTWRLDFTGQGRGLMDCCWCVWTRGWEGACETVLLPRPDEGVFA